MNEGTRKSLEQHLEILREQEAGQQRHIETLMEAVNKSKDRRASIVALIAEIESDLGIAPQMALGLNVVTPEQKVEIAEALLHRFVELYGETPLQGAQIGPGMKLFRDYHEFTGRHAILTEEGWEPGSAKAIYEDMAAAEELPISCFIHDEVSAPAPGVADAEPVSR